MSEGTLILTIETARRNWSVALYEGKTEISARDGGDTKASAENLLSSISEMLEENDKSLSDLKAIAVSRGPGSFTGIRVGLATARALSLGAKIQCCGVTLFEAMMLKNAADTNKNKILTALSAGRDQVYWQTFSPVGNEFAEDAEARLDDVAVFAEKLGEIYELHPKTEIIADNSLKEIVTKTNITNLKICFIDASDNLNEFIASKCRQSFSNLTAHKKMIETLNPFYIREVRIGS